MRAVMVPAVARACRRLPDNHDNLDNRPRLSRARADVCTRPPRGRVMAPKPTVVLAEAVASSGPAGPMSRCWISGAPTATRPGWARLGWAAVFGSGWAVTMPSERCRRLLLCGAALPCPYHADLVGGAELRWPKRQGRESGPTPRKGPQGRLGPRRTGRKRAIARDFFARQCGSCANSAGPMRRPGARADVCTHARGGAR